MARDHRAVEGLLHDLQGVHDAFRDGCARSEPREQFLRSMVGPCSGLERQSMAPMALRVAGGNGRAMPRGLSEVAWEDAQRLRTDPRLVADDLGDPEGVLICDASSVPKNGHDSVGGARQSGGPRGKVANCQVGVCAAYASRHGYAVVDTQRCLPEPWLTEAYAHRRAQGQVPDDRGFQTTPQFAATIVRELRDAGGRPFTDGAADGLSGHSPALLHALAACPGLLSCVAMPSDTRCGREGPVMAAKHRTAQGEGRARRVVPQQATPPMTVEAVAHSRHDGCGYRRNVSEGPQGPLVSELTKRQVTRCQDGQPDNTVGLVMKRTLGEPPASWYDISHAPVRSRLPRFVW